MRWFGVSTHYHLAIEGGWKPFYAHLSDWLATEAGICKST